jgi:putative phage-type endonuclease
MTHETITNPDLRRRYIGATDGAAVLGISPWKSRAEVWLEKTYRENPPDISDKEPIVIGNLLEDDVAELYHRQTGNALVKYDGAARHPDYPFIACHPDYKAMPDDDVAEWWLLECKTAGIASPMRAEKRLEWGLEGSDEIPQQYLVQCHHQMLCCPGVPWVDLAALIGGRGLVIHRVHRDEEFLRWYEAKLVEFWSQYVETDTPPPAETLADVKVLYREDSGDMYDGSHDGGLVASVDELRRLKAEIKDLETQAEVHEYAIKLAMKEAASLVVDGAVVATWKSGSSARVDTKKLKERYPQIAAELTTVTTSRRFLLKGGK